MDNLDMAPHLEDWFEVCADHYINRQTAEGIYDVYLHCSAFINNISPNTAYCVKCTAPPCPGQPHSMEFWVTDWTADEGIAKVQLITFLLKLERFLKNGK